MVAEILDGKLVASQIKEEIKKRIKYIDTPIGLGTVLIGNDIASQKYVAMKHQDCEEVGIKSIPVELPENASLDQVLGTLKDLNQMKECTGYIVQLPLPKHLDENVVLEHILPGKDADGLHPMNLGKLVLKVDQKIYTPLPCTPLGIVELLRRYNLDLAGRHAVIVGRGTTVGRPLGLLLANKDINMTVTTVHSGTIDIEKYTKDADLLVSAIGKPYFIKPEMVKPGAIVVDVGVSRIEVDGKPKIVGDIDPNVKEVASYLTPNPGGVGPMTRVMLLQNVVELGSY